MRTSAGWGLSLIGSDALPNTGAPDGMTWLRVSNRTPMNPILIVDDHEPGRFLRSRQLTAAGFTVTERSTAHDALEAVLSSASPPALVLLDVGLPDGDGFRVCQRIKEARPALPVILVSAIYRTTQARRDGFTAGADAYLVDPTPPDRLIATIRHFTSPDAAPAAQPEAIVRTSSSGIIRWTNQPGARMLNIGERAAAGRNLLTFFNGGRARLEMELLRAASGQVCEFQASLRPRERKPIDVLLDLAAPADGHADELEWLISPVTPLARTN